MVAGKMIILVVFTSAATSTTRVIRTFDYPTMWTRLLGCFFFGILVLVLLPMLIDYLNSCTRVYVNLALRLKLNLWEDFRWYLKICDLVSAFGCFQKSTRLYHGTRKNL
jgi:hypothetical protein